QASAVVAVGTMAAAALARFQDPSRTTTRTQASAAALIRGATSSASAPALLHGASTRGWASSSTTTTRAPTGVTPTPGTRRHARLASPSTASLWPDVLRRATPDPLAMLRGSQRCRAARSPSKSTTGQRTSTAPAPFLPAHSTTSTSRC
ncbi:hypothetical protein LPJ59_007201, partial [Coemansia sp. RSA 2399]